MNELEQKQYEFFEKYNHTIPHEMAEKGYKMCKEIISQNIQLYMNKNETENILKILLSVYENNYKLFALASISKEFAFLLVIDILGTIKQIIKEILELEKTK